MTFFEPQSRAKKVIIYELMQKLRDNEIKIQKLHIASLMKNKDDVVKKLKDNRSAFSSVITAKSDVKSSLKRSKTTFVRILNNNTK